MSDALSKVVAIIICVMLMIIAPVMMNRIRGKQVSEMYAYSSVNEFVQNVRNTGNITEDMYKKTLTMISKTINLYRIEIEHKSLGICYYTDEILSSLETNGTYLLKRGDYIRVLVYRGDELISVNGGMIKDEAY